MLRVCSTCCGLPGMQCGWRPAARGRSWIPICRSGLSLWKPLEIIGEAAGRITPHLRAAHPQVPWQLAIDTRNRLTHGYDTVDYSVVWKTVTEDLPSLVPALESILAELESTGA